MNIIDPNEKKRAAIEKARAAKVTAEIKTALPKAEEGVIQKFIRPADAVNRIRVVFDNSSSMNDSTMNNNQMSSKVEDAKKGVVEFLRNCVPNQDAVAVHLLNVSGGYDWEERTTRKLFPILADAILETDLIKVASAVDSPQVNAIGGTPLFERYKDTIAADPQATRIVIFSDGEPNNTYSKEECITKCIQKKIPTDTIFFGDASHQSAIALMKEIAERTGGIFLHFDPSKGVNFATAFKYLAPGKRLMLMDGRFKEKLERGEIK